MLPVILLFTLVVQAWRAGFQQSYVTYGVVLFVVGALLSRFLLRRSRNLDASFINFAVDSSDSEVHRTLSDIAALCFALFLLVVAVGFPWAWAN